MENLKYKANETKLNYIVSINYDYFLRVFPSWSDRHAVPAEIQKKIIKNLKPFLRQNCANMRGQQLKRAVIYTCNLSGANIEEVTELFNSSINIKIEPHVMSRAGRDF